MEINLKHNKSTEVILTINVDPDEIADVRSEVLKDLATKIKVQGFRKGHIPPAVVEKNVNKAELESEVLNKTITNAYQKAVTEKKLQVLDRPKIDITEFDLAKGLKFSATVPVMPEIKLYDYKKIKKSLKVEPVTDEEVQEVIDNLLTRSASYAEVKRKSENGDRVWIDFEGFDAKGVAFKGGKGDNYPLALGSNTFIPGFEEGLVGFKAGDKTELSLTFPKAYQEKSLAGKKVKFKVSVKKVEEVKKPEVDAEFLKQFGEDVKTLADLKKDIKEQLGMEKASQANKKLQDEIVAELVEKTEFDAPEVLIKDQVDMIVYDSEQNLKYRGTTLEQSLEQEGITKDQWMKDYVQKEAEKRVRIGIVISEVARIEDIKLSAEELESRLNLLRQQYASNKQALEQLNDPQVQKDVASRLVTEKAVESLMAICTK